jgi:hypothetical protein
MGFWHSRAANCAAETVKPPLLVLLAHDVSASIILQILCWNYDESSGQALFLLGRTLSRDLDLTSVVLLKRLKPASRKKLVEWRRRRRPQSLGLDDQAGRRTAAKLLTRDEERRIAVNIAKLPDLLRR